MFSMAEDQPARRPSAYRTERPVQHQVPATPSYVRAAPKPVVAARPAVRPEPTYHPIGMSAEPPEDDRSLRQ